MKGKAMSKRSDDHSLRRVLIANELDRRAGGDIDKILPALIDMLAERKQKKQEDEGVDDDFSW